MRKLTLSRRNQVLLGISTVLLIFFIIFLVLLPHGISYGLKQWMLENGDDRVSIENVDFNPFTGNIALYNLRADRLNKTPLTIAEAKFHIVWNTLLKKQIVVDGISIRGVRLSINQSEAGDLRVGGLKLDAREQAEDINESEKPWSFSINDIKLQDISVDYIKPSISHKLKINQLEINDLASFLPDQTSRVKIDAIVDDAKLLLDGTFRPFQKNPVFNGKLTLTDLALAKYASLMPPDLSRLQGVYSLDTAIELSYEPGIAVKIEHDTNISLKDFQLINKAAQIKLSTLHWQGQGNSIVDFKANAQQKPKTRFAILQQDSVSLQGLQISTETVQISTKSLSWAGQLDYTDQSEDMAQAKIKGSLNLQQSDVNVPAQQIDIKQREMAWTGSSEIMLDNNEAVIKIHGTTTSKELNLAAIQQELDLVFKQVLWNGDVEIVTKPESD
jgi:hypothetical protein